MLHALWCNSLMNHVPRGCHDATCASARPIVCKKRGYVCDFLLAGHYDYHCFLYRVPQFFAKYTPQVLEDAGVLSAGFFYDRNMSLIYRLEDDEVRFETKKRDLEMKLADC